MSSVKLSDTDLQSILEFTSTLARKAGELILEGSEAIAASGDVNEKKNSVDLVTEYDVRVEELVKEEIKKAYPGFQLCVSISGIDIAITDVAVALGRSPTPQELDQS
jgi:myo-inositol-1(or 4)-monophosphatase